MLTTKDLHNLRLEVREGKEVTEEERLLRVLENFLGEDRSSSVILTVDNTGELEMIYIQTTAMKKSMAKFPEVLILDSTYRCNNRKMPLSSIMAMDGNGKGQIVAHALLKNERQETLRSFLNTFKTENQTSSQTNVFLVDKDFNEMAVLKSLWPDANIFLCLWHVLRAFKVKISSLSLSLEMKDDLRKLCQEIAYARSEEQYSSLCEDLRVKSPEVFFTYLKSNWDSCKDMWVNSWRGECTHMGNQTTNRLESFHGKIKAYLHPNMTISSCVDELVKFNVSTETQSIHQTITQSVKTRYQYGEDSCLTETIQSIATPFAADILINQVKEAHKMNATVLPTDTPNQFIVNAADNIYSVTTGDTCSCDCPSFISQLLPCRHIIACILQEGLDFQSSWIPQRWTTNYNDSHNTRIRSRVVNVRKVACGPKMTRNQKFCEMSRLLRDIADMSADLGHRQFCSRYQVIVDLHNAWSHLKHVTIVSEQDIGPELVTDSSPEMIPTTATPHSQDVPEPVTDSSPEMIPTTAAPHSQDVPEPVTDSSPEMIPTTAAPHSQDVPEPVTDSTPDMIPTTATPHSQDVPEPVTDSSPEMIPTTAAPHSQDVPEPVTDSSPEMIPTTAAPHSQDVPEPVTDSSPEMIPTTAAPHSQDVPEPVTDSSPEMIPTTATPHSQDVPEPVTDSSPEMIPTTATPHNQDEPEPVTDSSPEMIPTTATPHSQDEPEPVTDSSPEMIPYDSNTTQPGQTGASHRLVTGDDPYDSSTTQPGHAGHITQKCPIQTEQTTSD